MIDPSGLIARIAFEDTPGVTDTFDCGYFACSDLGMIQMGDAFFAVPADEGSGQKSTSPVQPFLGTVTSSIIGMFQEADPTDEKDDSDPETQWGQELEPLAPGEFVGPVWQYNLLNPGPLPPYYAQNFAGGQYSVMTVGDDGWSFDAVYRVYGGDADELGQWWTPIPQSGGLQSQIDLNLRPEWGNSAENVSCVYLQPGTVVYMGPATAQTGYAPAGYTSPNTGISYGSGGPQSLGISGTLQIFIPSSQ